MRSLFLLLALVTACTPFGVVEDDGNVPASDDLTDAPPKKKKATTTDSPSTSTSPTMPNSNIAPSPPADVCAGATFCEDFEKGDQGNGLWETFEAINGDALNRTAPSASSGAFSLDFVIPAGSETDHSVLRRSIGDFGHVELTFSIQTPTTFGPAERHARVTHLDFGSTPEFVALIVGEENALGLVIKDDERDWQLVNKVAVSPATWHKVKLVVDLPANPPTAHLEIDGQDVVKLDELHVPFDGPPPLRVSLGPDYKTTQTAFDMRIDDFRIDARN